MYDAFADPACYAGTEVLKNIPGHRSQADLDRFEAMATGRRFLEPMPAGKWDVRHYQSFHRHLFQDVYRWAGRIHGARISKGSSTFCYPENIAAELRRVFAELRTVDHLTGLGHAEFATCAAHSIAELNAIHPFRDGNGRCQLTFMDVLATSAGHPLDFGRLERRSFLEAMITSLKGDEEPLRQQFVLLSAREVACLPPVREGQ